MKRSQQLEVRISIPSIKTEEIEMTEEADKYLSIFLNLFQSTRKRLMRLK